MSCPAPDFEGAYRLVHGQLLALPPTLSYHSIHHTFQDVLPCCIQLAQEEGLTPERTLLVKTAALFHDTGFLDQYDKNEPFGVERARKYLPQFGYSPQQIDEIAKIIMVTECIGPGHQDPGDDICCRIMCDADMYSIGSDCYFHRAEGLRLEIMRVKKKVLPARDWHIRNLDMVKNHHFFTESAERILGPVKRQNIAEIGALLSREPQTTTTTAKQ
ncbi:HD domain-containing protein [Plasmodiophora brassicae]|uniref:HD domain-containing protein n=1 Tax=Plasmodiophora brassicae TaxID=37360 RepID=A0A0G4ITQ4_PLABS|nr:hypothetical protein PBRA_006813 [Plasmodiophora brassicae]SPR00836.1 unnamed protein product [Plasmodiophora brassicae]